MAVATIEAGLATRSCSSCRSATGYARSPVTTTRATSSLSSLSSSEHADGSTSTCVFQNGSANR